MLRITKSQPKGVLCLRLEGKLIGPWVDVLQRVCQREMQQASALLLDLSGVSFVDGDGIGLLRQLAQAGYSFVACPGYVREMLRQEAQP